MSRGAGDDVSDALTSATEASAGDGVPEWLAYHRSERITEYDHEAFGWRKLMEDLLYTPEWPSNRANIHEVHVPVGEGGTLPPDPPRYRKLMHAFRHAGWKMPKLWAEAMRPGEEKRAFAALQASREFTRFMDAYRRFVFEEIAPTCGDPKGVWFQSPPTIRVAMPSVAPTIKPHSDSQYDRHQKCEMNFWVPVGRAFGNNALRVESRPGANDFVTITLSENQYFRFDGYNCTHFTVPNDTDYTRVSFDFRVVPASLYKPHADANGRKKNDGKIGDYRAEETGPVALREPLRGTKPRRV